MKTFILNSILIVLLFIIFNSCTSDSIEEFSADGYSIKTRSKSSKKAAPYTLIFQKEAFGFNSKRELYSFLAKKDKAADIYLAQAIISELKDKYTKKFGENFRKDNTIWNNFEEAIAEEFEVDQEAPGLACFICYAYPDLCEYGDFDFLDENDVFNLALHDDANYNGDNCLVQYEDMTSYISLNHCNETSGVFFIPDLTCDNQNWDNKISSFVFKTELPHSSSVLTFYSESALDGAELVFYLSEGETQINRSDLEYIYWNVYGIEFPVNNSISSISYRFHISN